MSEQNTGVPQQMNTEQQDQNQANAAQPNGPQAHVPPEQHTGESSNAKADSVQESDDGSVKDAEMQAKVDALIKPRAMGENEAAQQGAEMVQVGIKTVKAMQKTKGAKKEPVFDEKTGEPVMVKKRMLQPMFVEMRKTSWDRAVTPQLIMEMLAGYMLVPVYAAAKKLDVQYDDNLTFAHDDLEKFFGSDPVEAAVQMIRSKYTLVKGMSQTVAAAAACPLPDADYDKVQALNIVWGLIEFQHNAKASSVTLTRTQVDQMGKVFDAEFARTKGKRYPSVDVLTNIKACLSSVANYVEQITTTFQNQLEQRSFEKPDATHSEEQLRATIEQLAPAKVHITFVECMADAYLEEIRLDLRKKAETKRKKAAKAVAASVDDSQELNMLSGILSGVTPAAAE